MTHAWLWKDHFQADQRAVRIEQVERELAGSFALAIF
jgi:hypothetical protein